MSTKIIHQILVTTQRNKWTFVDRCVCANRQMRSYIGITVQFISN